MKSKSNLEKKILYTIIGSILIIVISFVMKFSILSFRNSLPEDWELFSSYFSNIINILISSINLFIFVKLTKSVQRASENKAWVERTEKLIFDYIESTTALTSFMTFATQKISVLPINKQKEYIDANNLNSHLEEMNKNISMNQFQLKIFIESEIFKKCNNKAILIQKTNQIIIDVNDFLNVYNLPQPDKSIPLMFAFNKIETTLKETIDIAKKFSDEIYHI